MPDESSDPEPQGSHVGDPNDGDASSKVVTLLAEAVANLSGDERPGQIQMAQAVADAFDVEQHLVVQAGTGTGKSLAYLVPAMLHSERVVVATATLALQHQLIERDLPALIAAVDAADLDTSHAVLKGRSNYACLHRVRMGVPDDQGTLVDLPADSIGAEVVAMREWVEEQADARGSGERDAAPRHTDRVWRQVSVSHRECLGTKCDFYDECFAERAKQKAADAHVIVTNHALLAIDAIEGVPMIPDYDAVVIDEAHEFVARVTQTATDDLSIADIDRLSTRAERHVDDDTAARLGDAADELKDAIAVCGPGRVDVFEGQLAQALGVVRDCARALISSLPKEAGDDAAIVQCKGWAQELFTTAERMAAGSDADVLWVSERPENRGGDNLHVAPLDVSYQVRDHLLADKTAVFTSATLKLGGDFAPVAHSFGLWADEEGGTWRSLDVGSPFDYPKQGILYVAKHLPPPGRDGLVAAQLDEIAELVEAAGGRTLGLFSSRRAAEAAGEHLKTALPHLTTLVQGEAQLPELTKQFVSEPETCLFGTLSLWQGIDVPGDTCRLVIIDRIPFPRPDDPLMSARQRAADRRGANGFMSVSATHAALLLAQGSGRLIRRTTDKGVVACLDPRLATARYGGFLRRSMPPMWDTTDPALVRQALARLATPE